MDSAKVSLGQLVSAYNMRHGGSLGSRGKSTLVLPAAMMQGFFDPIISSIISHVEGLLKVCLNRVFPGFPSNPSCRTWLSLVRLSQFRPAP